MSKKLQQVTSRSCVLAQSSVATPAHSSQPPQPEPPSQACLRGCWLLLASDARGLMEAWHRRGLCHMAPHLLRPQLLLRPMKYQGQIHMTKQYCPPVILGRA